jgi:pSer/pThr/pTyr-binding forkhead associated (FHA) protein
MGLLIGMSQDVKGRRIEIGAEPVTVGRHSDNRVVIENASVSGHHCRVERAEGGYAVTDLGSTNGTRINNRSIKTSPLRPKDILCVGSVEFMFDASPGEVMASPSGDTAKVEVDTSAVSAPPAFGNISPFGARRSKSMTLSYVLIGALGLVALAVVVLLVLRLMGGS